MKILLHDNICKRETCYISHKDYKFYGFKNAGGTTTDKTGATDFS